MGGRGRGSTVGKREAERVFAYWCKAANLAVSAFVTSTGDFPIFGDGVNFIQLMAIRQTPINSEFESFCSCVREDRAKARSFCFHVEELSNRPPLDMTTPLRQSSARNFRQAYRGGIFQFRKSCLPRSFQLSWLTSSVQHG